MLILASSTAETFCNATEDLFKILGIFITIIKIGIPIALIVFGMLDMGKAVTNGKDDEIKKEVMTFIRRIIAAVLVFFVIAIVKAVVSAVSGNSEIMDCANCFINGSSSCNSVTEQTNDAIEFGPTVTV